MDDATYIASLPPRYIGKIPHGRDWEVVTTRSYRDDRLLFLPRFKGLWRWVHPKAPAESSGFYLALLSDEQCAEFASHFKPRSFAPSGQQPQTGVRLPTPQSSRSECSPLPWLVGGFILGVW